MPLPHIRSSAPINPDWEPVTGNFFEVTLMPPGPKDMTAQTLLLKHVQSVGGLDGVNPSVEPITQKYKTSDRSYAGIPSQTFLDLNIVFSLNLRDLTDNYIYNTLRAWSKLIYNPVDGRMSLRGAYSGKAIINQSDRAGNVWRRLTCNRIFPSGQITGLGELSYTTPDPQMLTINFRCDQWNDETVGDKWNPVQSLPMLPEY